MGGPVGFVLLNREFARSSGRSNRFLQSDPANVETTADRLGEFCHGTCAQKLQPACRGKVYIQSILVETKMVHLAQVEGQIEYALMAGFVAVAAGAIMPNVANSISTILSEVASV